MTRQFNFEVIPLPEVPLGPMLMTNTRRARHILVVDDEPLIANTLVTILRSKGFAASAAYNAREAMHSAVELAPDVLLTDVMMPEMNGVELAIALKELAPDCAVILFSGHAYINNIVDDPRCAKYNFPLLSKPIHPDELLAHIFGLTEPTGAIA